MASLQNYPGSRLLESLGPYTTLNVDQLNFVAAQFFALGLAALYRTVFRPEKVSPSIRHAFGLLFGLWMGYFCFGYHAVHLAGLPAVCYLVILTQNPQVVHGAVLFVAMLYLSCVHLHRQCFADSSYGLDISGPLMVITQKVSSLAFSLHDGLVKRERDMTPSQKLYAIKKVPSLLEFFSYSMMFPSLMAGPVIFYNDYIAFIEGGMCAGTKKPPLDAKRVILRDPSPARAVFRKVCAAVVCALVFVLFLPTFPISKIKEGPFVDDTSLGYKLWYLTAATAVVRAKYYFAWCLADAACNNAGLGFSGYSPDGTPLWDRFSNVDIVGFECGTSLKESIDSWNKGTNRWLRFLVYDRVSSRATLLTFALSAIWHGFYPGYYLTFLGGALFTFASRTVRRRVRDHFAASRESKLFYDTSTFVATRLVMAYVTYPFVLLEFWPSVVLYNKLGWFLHGVAAALVAFGPRLIPKYEDAGRKNEIAMVLRRAGPYSDAVGRID
ncbi:lysophospholipid acyltransferase 6 [Cylas formicarius]|uniref:lysophospholipid acyltransferase 6 n=1 Tax=Cylas formicarius TaxID=197179 RepID=UPI0029589575|nr:lysophospholipid acyltransferase 6 [Cylas formicarius]XP_060527654.1 lysophospholipid acyltransferase 6 [Cylas formicarius]XP_060527655.1 lysophospholipid acyltransferase 6 [Cylas formicarius]XP_060527656.1 lysophospholipid acyltransferase 6 [Cylas formicarius]